VTWKVIGLRHKVQQDIMEAGLPQQLQNDFHALSQWAQTLPSKFGNRVTLRLIDAASIEGFFKSLVRWFRRYPAFTVDGERYIGSDFAQVDALIARSLSARG
jgi:hypothetical protein